MKPEKDGPRWEYRLDLSAVQPPSELLPIVIGDYLFDVRSALDHLIVSIAPRKHRYNVSFPIFRRDPLARREASGEYRDADAARRWLSLCCCLPDMHRTAHVGPALPLGCASPPVARIPRPLAAQFLPERRQAPRACRGNRRARQMSVKVKGVPTVAIQRGDEVWGFDMLVERLTNFLVDRLLPLLEPFVET